MVNMIHENHTFVYTIQEKFQCTLANLARKNDLLVITCTLDSRERFPMHIM